MTKTTLRLILLCQFTMILALEMGNPFLPLLVKQQLPGLGSHLSFYAALALLLPMMANILMTPLWGLAADRFGYKAMLLRAGWALTLSQAAMIFVHDLNTLLLIRFLQGGFAGFIAAMQAYALTLCAWENKARQLTHLQTAKALATTLAGLTGGMILSLSNFKELFFLAMLLCLLTTLLMHLTLPESPKSIRPRPQTAPGQTKPSTKTALLLIAGLIVLSQTARFFSDPFFSLYAQNFCQDKTWLIGLLYSLPAAGIFLAAPWCGRQFDQARGQPEKVRRYLLSFTLAGSLLMLAHGLCHQLALLILIRICWGLVLAALLPALFTLISDQINRQGYALGLANALAKTGNLFGLLAGGVLADGLAVSQLFLIIALIYGLMFVLSWTMSFLPQIRYLRKGFPSLESN